MAKLREEIEGAEASLELWRSPAGARHSVRVAHVLRAKVTSREGYERGDNLFVVVKDIDDALPGDPREVEDLVLEFGATLERLQELNARGTLGVLRPVLHQTQALLVRNISGSCAVAEKSESLVSCPQ